MAVTVPIAVKVVPDLPAAPSTTPAWLIRLVAFLLPLIGVALDVWNPSHRIDSSAAQAAVVVVFLLVAAIIFVVHIAIEAVHKYGWSKSAAGAFLNESGDELRSLIAEAKPLVDQAKPIIASSDALSGLAGRVGEVEHRLEQSANAVPALDRSVVEASVREVLASLVPGSAVQPPAAVSGPVPARETPLEASPAPSVAVVPAHGAPVTSALPGSAPAHS